MSRLLGNSLISYEQPPVPGQPFGGGFYAGDIYSNDVLWRIIVAPVASGESSTTLRYKNANTEAPLATRTLHDGPAATAAMVADGTSTVYPAAHFCNDLTINGFSDWYLPARDELGICYRNLKPTTTANSTANRLKSTYVYVPDDDLSTDTMGVNRSSRPVGAGFTADNPSQTASRLFRIAPGMGAEAFVSDIYWSSSEISAASGWRNNFSNGSQGITIGSKTNSERVRAVRRVPA
jgi:hypothetical protein